MFGYLLLLFTVVPAIELTLLIKIGTYIGAINTMLIIILTGVVGASLARYQGFLVLNKIQTELNKGVVPSSELMDGLMILVGGIVLLTPGFVTDFLGLMLLVPWTRSIIKLIVRKRFESMVERGQVSTFNREKPNNRFDDIDIN